MVITCSQSLHPDCDVERVNEDQVDDRRTDEQENEDQSGNRGNDESPLEEVSIHPRDHIILTLITENPIWMS